MSNTSLTNLQQGFYLFNGRAVDEWSTSLFFLALTPAPNNPSQLSGAGCKIVFNSPSTLLYGHSTPTPRVKKLWPVLLSRFQVRPCPVLAGKLSFIPDASTDVAQLLYPSFDLCYFGLVRVDEMRGRRLIWSTLWFPGRFYHESVFYFDLIIGLWFIVCAPMLF
jgi:hypothetical protein